MIRRGAALIIVLLILVALTLLGLPFLFSQTWGLAGARSMQAHQAAQIYLGTAERLGIALGIHPNKAALAATNGTDTSVQLHSALKIDLETMTTPAGISPLDASSSRNDAVVEPKAFGLNHGPAAAISVSIADESGMLDPNLLDAEGWADLFKKLEIPDWDDDDVEVIWQPGEGPDQDRVGELAQELSWYRVHTGRFARLDDLRIPTPQLSWRHTLNGIRTPHPEFRKRLNAAEVERLRPYLSFHNRGAGRRGLTDLGSIVASDQDLTVGVPASGGNPAQPPVIDTSTTPGKWFVPSRFSVDIGESILNHGTWIEAEPKPGDKPQVGLVRMNGNERSGYNYEIDYPGGTLPERDSGLWLQVPPALNIHQLSDTLRTLPAYKWGNKIPLAPPTPATELPDPLTTFPIRAYSQITAPALKPDLPWLYLRPRFTPFTDDPTKTDQIGPPRERQPLDLRSDGLVRVKAAASILDAAGGQAAQRARTTVVQAVPQEGPIEHRWITQGQFEPLVGQRFTSQMTTWPKATGRAIDVEPDDVPPSSTPSALTGLSFTTLAGPANFKVGTSGPLGFLDLRWRAPLGGRNPGTSIDKTAIDYVLNDRRVVSPATSEDPNGTNPVETGLTPPTLNQGAQEGLYPDGVRIGANTQLAYTFSQTGGPLRMANPGVSPAAPPDPSLGYCHVGFWFKPETDWSSTSSTTEPVTLMEARMPKSSADRFVAIGGLTSSAVPFGGTADQNYFGVFYDRVQNMLVAAYTPPCATAIQDIQDVPGFPGFKISGDDLTTAGVDERCLPGPNWLTGRRMNETACKNWSPTFIANRIMTAWKMGRRRESGSWVDNVPEVGRWYHLQLVIGNGRPGGIGILLDGIAGTDVGLMKATDYRLSRQTTGPWPGDHMTFPSLLLTKPLAPVAKPLVDPLDLNIPEIEVEMPGFAAFGPNLSSPTVGLTPLDTHPLQGSVLIGDEYIRYQGIKVVGSGVTAKYYLTECTRGDRQNSFTYSSDPLAQTPSTEQHAAGSRVLADGYRLQPNGENDLFLGGATTTEVFGNSLRADARWRAPITTITDATGLPLSGPTLIDLDLTAWAPDLAPLQGYCRIQGPTNSFYAWFKRVGAVVTLQPSVPQAGFPNAAFTSKLPALDDAWALQVDARLPAAGFFINNDATNLATFTIISLQVADLGTPGIMTDQAFQRPYGAGDFGSSSPHARPMFQIMDPVTGRCEWIRYTDIITDPDGKTYLIDRNGWNWNATDPQNRSRGQERTPLVLNQPFPIGSIILPVQTGAIPTPVGTRNKSNLNNYCKLMAPGDLITFVPKNFSAGQNPTIARVRYASNDGYDGSPDKNNDTVNGYFALTSKLPETFDRNSKNWEIVMGSGLNTPRDLTPIGPVNLPESAPPRLDFHVDGTVPGRLVLGAPDRERLGASITDLLVSVDGFYSGAWTNSAGRLIRAYDTTGPVVGIKTVNDLPLFVEADRPVFQYTGTTDNLFLIEIGGETFACERVLDADLNTLKTALANIPTSRLRLPGTTAPTPTDWVDSNRGRFAKLVGRALLGSGAPNRYLSTPVDIAFSASPDLTQLNGTQQATFGNLDRGPEFFRLPVGPVRYLTEPDKLSNGRWFQVDDVVCNGPNTTIQASGALANDVLMITEPNRSGAQHPWEGAVELMQIADRDERKFLTAWDPINRQTVDVLTGAPPPADPNASATNPNYNRMVTSWWLRGLYNTPAATDWTDPLFNSGGRGSLKPLVIGWWPRYASCLPSLRSTDSDPLGHLTPQHLRSRLFPWIGMAMRLHGARFEDTADEAAFALRLNAASNGCLDNQSGMRLEIRAMAGTINGREDVAGAFAGTSGIRGDWQAINPQTPSVINGWQYVRGIYPWNPAGGPATALETDGVEVRMHFRYTGVTTTDLSEIARNGGRAPLIGGAKLRCYAPVSIVATDEAR